MLKGITVTLHNKVLTGRDALNAPVYEEVDVDVENVLVAPVSSTEAQEMLDLTGKKVIYQLAIPKGDEHVWENQRVSFFGEDWLVVGFVTEGIEGMIPLLWNKKVQVERYGQ